MQLQNLFSLQIIFTLISHNLYWFKFWHFWMQTARKTEYMRREGSDHVVLHVLRSSWNHLRSYFWLRATGCHNTCSLEKKNQNMERENKDSVWYVLYKRTFPHETWQRQQKLLHWCCDKWLYSQLTFFCFSVLLECSPVCSSPCVYFCHFSLLLSREWHHPILHCVGR